MAERESASDERTGDGVTASRPEQPAGPDPAAQVAGARPHQSVPDMAMPPGGTGDVTMRFPAGRPAGDDSATNRPAPFSTPIGRPPASPTPIDGHADTDPPTDLLAAVAPEPSDGTGPSASRPRPLLIVAAVLGLLLLVYVVDVVVSLGTVPRGVTVADVSIGGLDYETAEQRLRTEIEPRTTRPVPVTVGQVRSELDPRAAGLRVDLQATLDRAGSQPLNPVTRIASLFTAREVDPVTETDMPALVAALEQLAPVVDRAPMEGTVAFEGVTPVPVNPVAGQRLEVTAAAEVLAREWLDGAVVALPLTELPSTTTPADVTAAIEEVARPAVSAPVVVLGEQGARGTVTPEVTAGALSFRAEPGSGLVPELNQQVIEDALRPQLASTETPGRDASINFASGAPVVVPSQDGRGIDYEATLEDLLDVMTGTGSRELTAVYAEQPAELTTEEINSLGIKELVGEFQTGGFADDSGLNIKRAAEQINGMLVLPGETFSLNAATVPRNAANGYVEAGIIDDGAPGRGVGGGVSQVATTLYNAAYFAGMVDVAHQEHSFYISRYPAGREATVFEGSIDLKFRNDHPTGILIQTAWTPSSITIRMYGTKRYDVTSTSGPRTNPTSPNTVTIPAGEKCSSSQGSPGFTITDTRTLREISTGRTRDETRTVRYNPSPKVVCGD